MKQAHVVSDGKSQGKHIVYCHDVWGCEQVVEAANVKAVFGFKCEVRCRYCKA